MRFFDFQINIPVFKSFRNDITIYTEDGSDYREIYVTLFNRLFNINKLRINDVYNRGSRKDVIELSKKCRPSKSIMEVFVVDGDIFLITEEDRSTYPSCLFILDAYCMENYLITANSIDQLAHFESGRHSIEEIKKMPNIFSWLNPYISSLIDLFIHLAIFQSIHNYFILNNITSYYDNDDISISKINVRINELKDEILKSINITKYNIMYSQFTSKWEPNIENLLKIVSGKSYLYGIALLHLKRIGIKTSLDNIARKRLLANHCDISRLISLKESILKYINNIKS